MNTGVVLADISRISLPVLCLGRKLDGHDTALRHNNGRKDWPPSKTTLRGTAVGRDIGIDGTYDDLDARSECFLCRAGPGVGGGAGLVEGGVRRHARRDTAARGATNK
jgi:hypothetical protein